MPQVIDTDHVIRLRRRKGRWLATVYQLERTRSFRPWEHPQPRVIEGAGRTCIGDYATKAEAIEAARTMIQMQGVPHLCSWRDVVEARQLMKKTNAQPPLND